MLARAVCVFPLQVAASYIIEPSHHHGVEKRGGWDDSCKYPPNCSSSKVPFGSISCSQTWGGQVSCNLSCSHGYTADGGSSSCNNGQLSLGGYCREIRCPSPPKVGNGVIQCGTSTHHKLNDVCYLRCNASYILSSPSSEVKCLSSETWSTQAVCVAKKCTPPSSVSHGL
ncbi:E-selectin-like [Haliotis rufescens]|uniref:E-selectin-like n=1 Tax=Haliotis rufescens TaxID=6454 RepID=UPI00201F2F80|nr:E-selectin-like [Haliotis rufescens]